MEVQPRGVPHRRAVPAAEVQPWEKTGLDRLHRLFREEEAAAQEEAVDPVAPAAVPADRVVAAVSL